MFMRLHNLLGLFLWLIGTTMQVIGIRQLNFILFIIGSILSMLILIKWKKK